MASGLINNLMEVNLNVLSLNMRGFNQSSEYTKEICDSAKYDCIFLQEHRCSPSSMFKLQNLSPDYLCYGKSAMEAAVSTGFIKGRPFGGTAILVRKVLSRGVTSVLTFDRVVALEICNFLFVNVYMPCEN